MLTDKDIALWLEVTNRRYSSEGVPHKARPFTAMGDFSREYNCSFAFDHPTAKTIFQWFYEHSPPGAHQVGSVYTAVYLYDTAFWPVHVPLIFGEVSVNALDCLETMPSKVKEALASSHQDMWVYATHWVNCMDYGYGQMDLSPSQRLKPRAAKFLGAAHAELQGANSQLLDARPNVKAILSLRMATEIFLKTVLVQELALTDDELRKVSHKLEDAARKCAETTKERTFEDIAERVHFYPPVSARYDDTDWPTPRVWEAVTLAQLTAATVTRLYSDRDMRSAVFSTEANT